VTIQQVRRAVSMGYLTGQAPICISRGNIVPPLA